jgi:iron complex outermembrane recepter protein
MKFSLLSTTCALALAAIGQTASAQAPGVNATQQTNEQAGAPTPGAAPAGAAAEEQGGLQDIIVTAQRREENLQRAAIAVSAVTGDMLAAAGVTRPTELTSLIPSLQVAPAAGPYNLFYLRGVGNFQGNALSESAISFNVDGVYIGRPSGTTGFFYDLERLEVVKGPQGTLYGRNATGGAINVITRKPDLNAFGANASIEYGNYDALRIDGAVNVPLGTTAAIRE